ncbi:MAG: HupE/UreJ family protein [Pseudomonadota bacterium]
MRTAASTVLLACLCLTLVPDSLAHSRGETWSSLQVNGQQVSIVYSLPAADLARYLPALAFSGNLSEQLTDAVTRGFTIRTGGAQCVAGKPDVRQGATQIDVRWQARCPPGKAMSIINNALFDQLPNHLHISQVVRSDGEIREHLFTAADRRWDLDQSTGMLDTLAGYFHLGVIHIVTGYDHLAFLCAVMLLTPRLVSLLLMVTGFAIGHSLTLALAVLGYARVDSSAVEALIGFTIALVAAEVVALRHSLQPPLMMVTSLLLLIFLLASLAGRLDAGPGALTLAGLGLFCICYLKLSTTSRLQDVVGPILTFLFGLIHGFGFAGLLTDIGLPREYLLPALIGFNLGVEAGQLVVLCSVLAAGMLLVRRIRLPAYTTETIASALCGLGLFLFVSRSLAS